MLSKRQFVLHSPLDGGIVVGPSAEQKPHLPRVAESRPCEDDSLEQPFQDSKELSTSELWRQRKQGKRKKFVATTGTAVRMLNRDRSHASSKVRLLSEIAAAQSDYDAWQRPKTTSSLPVDLPLIETALGLSVSDLHDLSPKRPSHRLDRARATLSEHITNQSDDDGSFTSYFPDCPPVHIPSPEPSLTLADDENVQVQGSSRTRPSFGRVVGVAHLATRATMKDKTVSWGLCESMSIADPQGRHMSRLPTPPPNIEQHSKDSKDSKAQDSKAKVSKAPKQTGRVHRLNKRIRTMRRNTRNNLDREGSSEDRPQSPAENTEKDAQKEASVVLITSRSRFEICARLAKLYHVPISKVRTAMDEFSELDVDGNGFLTLEEFKAGVRKRCDLPDGQEFPEHLLRMQWSRIAQGNETTVGVSFTDYLAWVRMTAFTEELLIPSEQEKFIRQLAREGGLALTDVEKIKKVFDMYDADGSGFIDKEEFKTVVCTMLDVKDPTEVSSQMLDRYWTEVDGDGSGELEFDEFLKWYVTVFDQ